MTPDELGNLCVSITSHLRPRWHRSIGISYRRCKQGLPSNYADFTWRERFYVWTGINL